MNEAGNGSGDGFGRGGDDGHGFDDDDISEATVIEDFSGSIASQFGRRICAVGIDLGRFGHGLGGLGAVLDGLGDVGQRADALTTAHATGCNVARCLREALEAVTAANELLGKSAAKARSLKEATR